VDEINRAILELLRAHKNSHIYLGRDKHYYSVPYRHIGKQVKILYTDSFVEIYHRHERLAVHERKRQRYDRDLRHNPTVYKVL